MATEALKRYSVEEYLAIDRASETKSEFYDGEIFAMAGASEAHNLIVANLIRELGNALRDGPFRIYPSDMRLRVPTGLYTYPDVTVVCSETALADDGWHDTLLNPTVIVEVLSRSTEAYDRGTKFSHYRAVPSLHAYVLVAEDRKSIDHFASRPDGTWVLTPVEEGELTIPALDMTLRVEDVYRKVRFPDHERLRDHNEDDWSGQYGAVPPRQATRMTR